MCIRDSLFSSWYNLRKVSKLPLMYVSTIYTVSYTHLFNAYPYRAVTYATQKIIRQSNVTERSLVQRISETLPERL